MELPRKQTRQLKLGSVRIGGGAPIAIQSMTNTDTRDVEATLGQIKRLHDAGCEIVRVAVPDETAARPCASFMTPAPSRSSRTFILTTVWPSWHWSGIGRLIASPRQHR